MPRIKEYTSQVGGPQELPLSQVSRQAFASDFSGDANGAVMAGRGLQEAASDGVAIQRMLDDQKARQEVTDVAVELARFNSSAAHELKNAETSGALDSESFTEEYMARINTNLDLVGQKYQTAAGRQAWERGSAEMSGHYLISAGEAYSKAAGIKAVAQAKDFVDVSRNTLMNDPFQFERVEQGVANAISDPRGVFAHMPAQVRDEFLRTTKTELAKSAVQGVIRLDPNIAMKQLTSSQWDAYLDADAKHALQTEARVGIAGLDAEARRQEAEQLKLRKREINGINNQFVSLWANGQLKMADVLNSNLDATGDGSKEHWVAQINAQAKEAKRNAEDQTHPEQVRALMLEIHANEGDPKKTFNMDSVNAEYQAGRISTKEYMMLRTEVEQLRDGSTNGFQRDVQTARNTVTTMLSRSIMGQVEPEKAADASYRFTVDLNNAIAEKRKANEDPRTLLDPKSKDYMLSPERIKTYMKPPAVAMADEAAKIKSGEVTATYKEYDSLPPGTMFTDPQGNVRRKPGDAASAPSEAQESVPGLITPGNIDLTKRVPVDNGDGTFSTVKSASFEINGQVVLLPTLDPKGRQMTNNEALTRYDETGKHLGIFKTEADATAYAKKTSKRQETNYPQANAAAAVNAPKPTALQHSVQELQNAIQRLPGAPMEEPDILDPNGPSIEPAMLDPNGPSIEPAMLDPNGPAIVKPKTKAAQDAQQAITELERAVRTMKGVEPIHVEPRRVGESAASYIARWNEAHK